MALYELIIAGFGGQGILLIGQLLAYGGNIEKKEVSWLPSYGPEMRGGTANCMVVVSDKTVNSPLILEPHGLITMNKPSLVKFEPKLRANGLVVINEDMVDINVKRSNLSIVKVKADTIAEEIGSEKVSNMVALGAFIGATSLLPLESLSEALKKTIPSHRSHLVELNKKALQRGFEIGLTQTGGNLR